MTTDWVQAYADHYDDVVRMARSRGVDEAYVMDAWESLWLRDAEANGSPRNLWLKAARDLANAERRRRALLERRAPELNPEAPPVVLAMHPDMRRCPVDGVLFDAHPRDPKTGHRRVRARETCSQGCGNIMGHRRRKAA